MTVTANTLIFFINGVGREIVEGKRPAAFGYGGCAVMARTLKTLLQDPWRDLKERHFGGRDHLVRPTLLEATAGDRVAAVSDFLRAQPLFRFAIIVRDPHGIDGDPATVEAAFKAMAPPLVRVLGNIVALCTPPPEDVALFFEGPAADGPLAVRHFGRLQVKLAGNDRPVKHCFMSIATAEPGLEVAEFVAVAAARLVPGSGAASGGGWPDLNALFPDMGCFVEIDGTRLTPA